MVAVKVRDVIKTLEKAGWQNVRTSYWESLLVDRSATSTLREIEVDIELPV